MEIERRDIEWYEDYYQVSNTWLVKALERTINCSDWRKRKYKSRIIKTYFGWSGSALSAHLSKEWLVISFSVARLVFVAFARQLTDLEVVRHIDWNPENNNFDNLIAEKTNSYKRI